MILIRTAGCCAKGTKGSLAGLEVSLEPFSKSVLSRNFGHSLFAVSLTSPSHTSFKVSPATPWSAGWDGGALAVKCQGPCVGSRLLRLLAAARVNCSGAFAPDLPTRGCGQEAAPVARRGPSCATWAKEDRLISASPPPQERERHLEFPEALRICRYQLWLHCPFVFLNKPGFFFCYVYLRGTGGDTQHRVWSEDNMRESGFSFHHTGPGNRTQVSKLGCKHLYLMSNLDDSLVLFSDSDGMVLLCSPRWTLTRDSASTSRDS